MTTPRDASTTPSNPASGTNEAAIVDLPERIVVDANGAYWCDYGTHYSMCRVSEDNDAIVVLAEYRLAPERAIGSEACTAFEPHGECRFGNGPAKGKYSGWRCYRTERTVGAALDVERLRRAIDRIRDRGLSTSLDAVELAAEYARLASETPRPGERKPFDVTDDDRDAPDGTVIDLTDDGRPGLWERVGERWEPVEEPTP